MTDTIRDTRLACGRMDIRTGVGRRRRWTAQEKGRIVAEALNAGVPVAEIARRHDMSSQHLFNWIGAAKKGRLALPADEGAVFVPIVAATMGMGKAPNAAATAAIESRAISPVVNFANPTPSSVFPWYIRSDPYAAGFHAVPQISYRSARTAQPFNQP